MDSVINNSLDDPTAATLAGLRDALRSVRRWRELLTDADRQTLLADIARVGLAVGRDLHEGLHDLDIGESTSATRPCPIERLAFLQAALPGVLAALTRIENTPPATLRIAEREVPIERARQISSNALRTLVTKIATQSVGGSYRIRETVHVPTHDTPATRNAKTIVVTFARDLTIIAGIAQSTENPSIATEAEWLRSRFQRALRRPIWRDLPLLPRIQPLAPTLLKNGPHRLLHDTYARYRNGFAFDWSHPLFRLSARETWQLYEYWCVFSVIAALRDLGFRTAQEENFTRYAEKGLTLMLAIDRASRLILKRGGERVIVTFQRRFERGDEKTSGIHSRAQTLIPDITVERPDGQLLVVDAKFKTYAEPGAETDDIRQMHTYRDALRIGDRRPVVAAWLLFPGRVDGAGRKIIAYPNSSDLRPFGNGEVGAMRNRVGDIGRLTSLLANFLAVP